MANIDFDGVTVEVPDNVAGIIKGTFDKRNTEIENLKTQVTELTAVKNDSVGLQEKVATIEAEKATSDAELAKVKAELEASTAKVAELEKQQANATKTDLAARRSLERKAHPYLVKNDSTFKEDAFDTMSDRDIQEAVIKLALPELAHVKNDSLSKADDVVINAYWQAVESMPVADSNGADLFRDALGNVVKNDSFVDNNAQAVKASQERAENAWKTTLGIN